MSCIEQENQFICSPYIVINQKEELVSLSTSPTKPPPTQQ